MAVARNAVAPPEVTLRVMNEADVPAVVALEAAAYQFPWSEGIFRDCLRVGYLCRVVVIGEEVCGYGIMSMGAGEAHVLNVCVRIDYREQGVGRYFMQLLFEHARNSRCHDIFLEVRPSNPQAIYLYESLGFQRVGVRKGYYQASSGREDAWVYKLAL